MYICGCRAVTDRTIRAAISAGASTVEEVAERCSAGGACGACSPEVQRLLDVHCPRYDEHYRAIA